MAILLGGILGVIAPDIAKQTEPLAKLFINLIKMLIAPVIFLTIVTGIGKVGSIRKFGRIGGKALAYFLTVTTFALLLGLLIGNTVKPGSGVDPQKVKTEDVSKYVTKSKEKTATDYILEIVPESIIGAFAAGNILQVLLFSVLFGIALSQIGVNGQSLITVFEKIAQALFKVLGMIMKLAPLGAFAGISFAIGKYGWEIIVPLLKLLATMYLTMFLFVCIVLNIICLSVKMSLWKLLAYIREEILIVLGTSSSETVLPRLIEKMEKFGCSKQVAGLVIPTGYSFNLDGTSIYLSMSVIFLAQVFSVELSLARQMTIIGVLILTSKGAAGVTGSGFIVLASTLSSFPEIPLQGLGILLAVDKFMSEARSITNLIGNAVATVVIAKSEKEFV
jgi:aerobic C4-dicarboxylate transport protein